MNYTCAISQHIFKHLIRIMSERDAIDVITSSLLSLTWNAWINACAVAIMSRVHGSTVSIIIDKTKKTVNACAISETRYFCLFQRYCLYGVLFEEWDHQKPYGSVDHTAWRECFTSRSLTLWQLNMQREFSL